MKSKKNQNASSAADPHKGATIQVARLPQGDFAMLNRGECATTGDAFLTPAELAKRWHWHVETIRLWLRKKCMDSVIISRRRLIPISEVQRVESSGLVRRTI